MRPTQQQVQRSLEALQAAGADDFVGIDIGVTVLADVPVEVLTRLDHVPELRADRLERARRRLVSGDGPTAEDLAGRMIDRLVCDRLR